MNSNPVLCGALYVAGGCGDATNAVVCVVNAEVESRGAKMTTGDFEREDMIVVLGATGQLGSILRLEARKSGLEDRFIWHSRQPNIQGNSGTWICWDPASGNRSADQLANRIRDTTGNRPVTVLNLAGATPAGGNADPDVMNGVNVDVAGLVMEAAKLAGASRVLLASSSAVYGRPKVDQKPFTEICEVSPQNAYGRSKVLMEQLVQADVETCILRIGNVAGADALLGQMTDGDTSKPHRFSIDQFASQDGPLRSYIGPESFFRVIMELVNTDQKPPRIVNVASRTPVTMNALLDAWNNIRPNDLIYTFNPAPPQAIESVVLDTAILQGLIRGWSTACSADTIVAETIRHFLEGCGQRYEGKV